MNSSGEQGSGDHRACGEDTPVLSRGGRYVAFTSSAANFHALDSNEGLATDVFVRDRKTARTDMISVMDGFNIPPSSSVVGQLHQQLGSIACFNASFNPAISSNGRYVAFASLLPLTNDAASVPVSSATAGQYRVYVRDREKQTTKLVSRGDDGLPLLGDSGTLSIEMVMTVDTSFSQISQLLLIHAQRSMDCVHRSMYMIEA